ncbi:MAG TPA: hypothetical protein VIG62_12725 [Blastocatellia bacterium]|jgi:hypothetical protein
MRYDRFEDQPDWQAAVKLALGVYSMTAGEIFKGRSSMRDQIERGATQELLSFILEIATF